MLIDVICIVSFTYGSTCVMWDCICFWAVLQLEYCVYLLCRIYDYSFVFEKGFGECELSQQTKKGICKDMNTTICYKSQGSYLRPYECQYDLCVALITSGLGLQHSTCLRWNQTSWIAFTLITKKGIEERILWCSCVWFWSTLCFLFTQLLLGLNLIVNNRGCKSCNVKTTEEKKNIFRMVDAWEIKLCLYVGKKWCNPPSVYIVNYLLNKR